VGAGSLRPIAWIILRIAAANIEPTASGQCRFMPAESQAEVAYKLILRCGERPRFMWLFAT
jgi:hypothetical protein